MPYVTSVERFGIEKGRAEGLREGEEKGLRQGIEQCLRVKFGAAGLQLSPEIGLITDIDVLRTILQAIETANTPEDLRQVWARQAPPG